MRGVNLPLIFALIVGAAIVIDYGVKSTKTAFANAPSASGSQASNSSAAAGGPISSGDVPFPGGWSPGRLDMGYDGTFTGQIVAPFSGTITYASSDFSNWGGYVELKSDSGQIADLGTDTLYFAEGLVPLVKSGSHVSAGSPIARAAASRFNGIVGNIEWGPAQSGSSGAPTDPLAKAVSDPRQMVLTFSQWVQSALGLAPPATTDHAGSP